MEAESLCSTCTRASIENVTFPLYLYSVYTVQKGGHKYSANPPNVRLLCQKISRHTVRKNEHKMKIQLIFVDGVEYRESNISSQFKLFKTFTPPYQQIFIEISIFAKCSIVFRVNTFSKEESKFLKSDTAAVRPKATFTVKMQR